MLLYRCSMGIVEPKFMNATHSNISLLLQLMNWEFRNYVTTGITQYIWI